MNTPLKTAFRKNKFVEQKRCIRLESIATGMAKDALRIRTKTIGQIKVHLDGSELKLLDTIVLV